MLLVPENTPTNIIRLVYDSGSSLSQNARRNGSHLTRGPLLLLGQAQPLLADISHHHELDAFQHADQPPPKPTKPLLVAHSHFLRRPVKEIGTPGRGH